MYLDIGSHLGFQQKPPLKLSIPDSLILSTSSSSLLSCQTKTILSSSVTHWGHMIFSSVFSSSNNGPFVYSVRVFNAVMYTVCSIFSLHL